MLKVVMDTTKPTPAPLPAGDEGTHTLSPVNDGSDSPTSQPVPFTNPPLATGVTSMQHSDDEPDLGPEIDPALQEVIDRAAKDMEAHSEESELASSPDKLDADSPSHGASKDDTDASAYTLENGTPIGSSDTSLKPTISQPTPTPSVSPFAPPPPVTANQDTSANSQASIPPLSSPKTPTLSPSLSSSSLEASVPPVPPKPTPPTVSDDTSDGMSSPPNQSAPLPSLGKSPSSALTPPLTPPLSSAPGDSQTPQSTPSSPLPITPPKSSVTPEKPPAPPMPIPSPSTSSTLPPLPPLPGKPGLSASTSVLPTTPDSETKMQDKSGTAPSGTPSISTAMGTPGQSIPPLPPLPGSTNTTSNSFNQGSSKGSPSDTSASTLPIPPLPSQPGSTTPSTTPLATSPLQDTKPLSSIPPLPSIAKTPSVDAKISPLSGAPSTETQSKPAPTSQTPPPPPGLSGVPMPMSSSPNPNEEKTSPTQTPITPSPDAKDDSSTGGKPKSNKSKKLLFAIAGLVILVVGLVVGLIVLQMSQDVRQQAFETTQSAQAQCLGDGQIALTVSFSNNAPAGSDNAVRVTARDTASGKTIDLGLIDPGQSKADKLTIQGSNLAAGQVVFEITAQASGETTSVAASYSAVSCQVTCPVVPTANGVMMSHAEFLRSDQSEAQAIATKNLTLPQGTYSVSLTSYDKHSTENAGQAQKREQYYVIFRDAEGNELARSGTISDLEEDKDFKTELVNEALEIPGLTTSITFYHAAYPDTSTPNSVYPLCAVFEPVDTEPVPTPSPASSPVPSPSASPVATPSPRTSPVPTPSPTPAPTPTPVTNYCNTSCSQTSDCNRYDSNLVCHNSQCRRNDNLSDSTCAVPVKVSCNSECVDNNGCSALGSQYSCVQGNCRLTAYPDRADCSMPPSPTPTSVTQVTGGLNPSPQPVPTQDLPEAGSMVPTAAALTIGFLILILGAGILLVP